MGEETGPPPQATWVKTAASGQEWVTFQAQAQGPQAPTLIHSRGCGRGRRDQTAGQADPGSPGHRTCSRTEHLPPPEVGEQEQRHPPSQGGDGCTGLTENWRRAGTRRETFWQEVSEGRESHAETKPLTQLVGSADRLSPTLRANWRVRPVPGPRTLGFGLCCSIESIRHLVRSHEIQQRENHPSSEPDLRVSACHPLSIPTSINCTAAPLGRDPRVLLTLATTDSTRVHRCRSHVTL